MEDRFETFTVLIARISRSIRRLKAEEMERLGLKGPHVSCLYYLSLYDELTAAELCERCDEDQGGHLPVDRLSGEKRLPHLRQRRRAALPQPLAPDGEGTGCLPHDRRAHRRNRRRGQRRLGCGGACGHVPGARDDREPSRTDLR